MRKTHKHIIIVISFLLIVVFNLVSCGENKKYLDGVYQCELHWINWSGIEGRIPTHGWNSKVLIEDGHIQYVTIPGYNDTIWTNDIPELKITKSRTYNFTTVDGMDFRLSLQ